MNTSSEWSIRTPHEMEAIAKEVLEKASEKARAADSSEPKATVIGLYGDLGAGKTTFTQILARDLGVTEHVTSPTFVIQKVYSLSPTTSQPFERLVHIDAYRLESSHELEVLGWKELLKEPKTLIAIEWPERVSDIMPPDHIQLRFALNGEHNRKVTATYI